MKMKVLVNYVGFDALQETEYAVNANDSMTIQELLDEIDCKRADLSGYYPMSGIFTWNEPLLPYLITDRKVSYDVEFRNAKVKDFLCTHNISDNTIHITTYNGVGEPGFLPLIEIWGNVYPVLEVIAVLVTISGFSLKDLFYYLRTHFMKRNQPPQTCFDVVYSRKCWSATELAGFLDIEVERAKELLKLVGYHYDKAQMQYIQGELTDEIKEKLMNIDVHDI